MRYTIKLLLLLAAIAIGNIHTYAKLSGQAKLDSLLKELPKAKEDTTKCNILNSIAFEYRRIAPDKAIAFGVQDSVLAEKLQWKKGLAMANNVLGNAYENKIEHDKALIYLNKALKINNELNNKRAIGVVNMNIGSVYGNESNIALAREYFNKALKIFDEAEDKSGAASACNLLSLCYSKQGDFQQSLMYGLKAEQMQQLMNDTPGIAASEQAIGAIYYQIGDFSSSLAMDFKAEKLFARFNDKFSLAAINGNIGAVYEAMHNYPGAREYFLKSLKMSEDVGNKSQIIKTTNNIGLDYSNEGNYQQAIEYYFKAFKNAEEFDKHAAAMISANIGVVFDKQHDYTQAVSWEFKAVKLAEEIGSKDVEAMAFDNIGSIYANIVRNTGRATQASSETGLNTYMHDSLIPNGRVTLLHKSVEYITKAIVIQQEIGALKNLQDSYKDLSGADSLLGDYKGAYLAHVQYTIIKDSVFSKDNSVKIARLEAQKKADADSLKSAQERHVAELKYQRQRNYTLLGIGGVIALLGFSVIAVRNNRRVSREKKRSDDLLLNILPEEVAGELKERGSAAARHYDNVSVLFTDFVNFTSTSERMTPHALVEELHTCFQKFDEIMERHNLEKIKTIGDAYLAAAGLPTADKDHATHAVQAAIEIRAYMEDRYAKLGDSTFQVRIGIHSGSVVAGIVGSKKFAYDIWGDTVNTAARMEQHSEPGRINISEVTYQLVHNKFSCEYRGEIAAKGKGMMRMYYI